MALRDLIPWGRHDKESRLPVDVEQRNDNPLSDLHREMNRLFDDVLRGWDVPAPGTSSRGLSWPHVEVRERENQILVTAELPGMSEGDVEVTVEDGVLTLRGERRQESDDKERGYTERFYGRFERQIGMPRGVEADKAEASFRDGVLTVTVPRSAETDHRRRVPINAATRH